MSDLFRKFLTVLMVLGLVAGAFVEVRADEETAEDVAAAPAMDSVAPVLDPADEMRTIQMQLQQLSMQLSEIHQQAFESEQVKEAFAAYEKEMRAKMIALSPESEEDIQQAEDLIEVLRSVENPMLLDEEELEDFQEKYMTFQQTVQRLQPIEQEAANDPDIQAMQEGLEALLLGSMEEINASAPAMIEERENLIERYLELELQRQEDDAPEATFELDIPDL